MPNRFKKALRHIHNKLVGKVLEKASRKELSDFYSQTGIISHGDLVFDLGANTGSHTDIFLELGARVVCVDPDPYCVQILNEKFGSNKRVTIVSAGVGDKNGEMVFHISERHGSSTFSDSFKQLSESAYKDQYTGAVKAKIVTLDGLMGLYGVPKYCKIDVEGFERQVLAGMSRKIQYISFEFHRETLEDAKACAEHLSSLGNAAFNYTHHDHSKSPFCLGTWSGYGKMFEEIMNEPKSISDATGDINFYRVGDIFVKLD